MTNKEFLFYRRQIPFKYRACYNSILEGLHNGRTQIKVSITNEKLMSEIMEAVILDNPMVYYHDGYEYSQNRMLGCSILHPNYVQPYEEKENNSRLIFVERDKILNRVRSGQAWDTLLSLHDILCKNIKYEDYGFYAHTVYGVIFNKKGVCDGISKTFKLCCDALGIECIVVRGTAKSEYEGNDFESHAWNKVKLNEDWYNIDVTFDTTISQPDFVRHDYFMVSDDEIKESHRENMITVECSNKGEFYENSGLLMHSPQDLYAYILKNLNENGEFKFEFQIPDLKDVEVMETKIFQTLDAALQSTRKSQQILISVNKERLSAFVRIG